jgi:hypothetical protein
METHVAFTGTEQHLVHETESGSIAAAVGGAGAVVLAIVGLIGLIPGALAAIATIALGAVLMLSSGALVTRYSRAFAGAPSSRVQHEIAGGLGLEGMAGLSAVVLGILALLGADPSILLNAAAIVLGAGLIMASGALARLEALTHANAATAPEAVPQEVVHMASGADVLVGGAAVVLGIVGLGGHDPVTLALVALLCIGSAVMITGSTLATRMFSLFN